MGKLFSKTKRSSSKLTVSEGPGHKYQALGGLGHPDMVRQYQPVHTEAVTSVCAVAPGLCFSGSKDQSAVLFNFVTGTAEQRWSGHDKEVSKVAYGEIVQSYFTASRDKTVNMWQRTSQEPTLTFTGHDLIVTGLSLSPDNRQLCTGSRDNSIRTWDVSTGQTKLTNSLSRNLVTHVTWAKSTNLIAQTGEDKEVRLWDASSLQVAHVFPKKLHIQTWCDIDHSDTYLVTCSNGFQGNGCESTLWDLRMRNAVHEFKGHEETVCCCVFLPVSVARGRPLIATSSNDCTVRIWDRDMQVCLAVCSIPGSGPLTSVAAFEDGSLCVSSFNTGVHVLQTTFADDGSISLKETAQF